MTKHYAYLLQVQITNFWSVAHQVVIILMGTKVA